MKIVRKPEWLQKKISPAAHAEMDRLLGDLQLNTVCREAMCPNISECFRCGQATFLILGTRCTRRCTFCNVSKDMPLPPDPREPGRVAEAVGRLDLRHAVVTSPTRDDLDDGGASEFAATVAAIRSASTRTTIELLIPDFQGRRDSLATVVSSRPDVLGHNVETVPRLYTIRSGANYETSLEVLSTVRDLAPDLRTKSGMMLGLGERQDEVVQVFDDLRKAGCSWLSLGQYLAPSRAHFPVQEYIAPDLFETYRKEALARGFDHVESGPYVRSSYHADHYR